MKISYGKNVYGKEEINSVIKQLQKTTQMGSSVRKFEQIIAEKFSKKFGLMVNSGSSALTLAMNVLNFKKNDEIIIPCCNFGTALSSIMLAGAKPILVDIEIDTLQIDVSKIEKKITKKTKAIMVPNLIGNLPDFKKIKKIANKYKLKVIEDSADTLGAKIGNKPTGYFSDISITSFYGSHVISCAGNGGMFLTNDKKIYNNLLKFRTHGIHKNKQDFYNKDMAYDENGNINQWYYEMSDLGYNYRITDIQSALGISQLKKIDKFIKARRKIAKAYDYGFSKNKFIKTPKENENVKHAYHLYTLLIDFKKIKKSRNEKMKKLKDLNIGTQVLYIPVHLQPYYLKKYNFKKGDFPNSEIYYESCLSIPIFPGISKKEINFIIEKINDLIK